MSTSDSIMILVPIMLTIALWGFKWVEQRLSPAKRAELDYYANKAVKYIEQTCTGTSSQKKNAAISMIYAFFKAIKKPAPAMIFIDAAIEEVVWMINQGKLPKEFMMPDDKPTINTGPIKPILPPDLGGQTV